MPIESVGSCDCGQMPGDASWIVECYNWAISYMDFILGEPPGDARLKLMWHEHELGSYPSIGVSWEISRPDEYISKCELLLERFDRAVDWHSISPNSTLDLIDNIDTDND